MVCCLVTKIVLFSQKVDIQVCNYFSVMTRASLCCRIRPIMFQYFEAGRTHSPVNLTINPFQYALMYPISYTGNLKLCP